MYEKQKITQINRYTSNKDGSPLTFKGKDGKQVPYTRILLKTDREGDKLMSGFGNKENSNWKVGDEIEINCVPVSKDGKTFYNFEMPKKNDVALEKVIALEITVMLLKKKIDQIIEHLKPKDNLTSDGTKVPDFSEVDISDIPF